MKPTDASDACLLVYSDFLEESGRQADADAMRDHVAAADGPPPWNYEWRSGVGVGGIGGGVVGVVGGVVGGIGGVGVGSVGSVVGGVGSVGVGGGVVGAGSVGVGVVGAGSVGVGVGVGGCLTAAW